ncbi:hypothetical protein D3C79_1008840 [compost metagenome]
MQGKTEDHRQHQHLQDVAGGEGADDGARDHVQQEADDALVSTGRHISGNL